MVMKLFIRGAFILFWLSVIGACISLVFMRRGSAPRALNVCAWIGMFDAHSISRFEHETGIKVNVSYFESNEELLLKLEKSSSHGYDLIVPSDYAVYHLARRGLLKKMDKKKMAFYAGLNPLLLGHYFDQGNDYSVPFEWAVFGLGINKECFPNGLPEKSWALVFDQTLADDNKIIMTNDPLVALPLASLYLYGSPNLTKQRLPSLKGLLRRQYSFVEVYSDMRAHYYLASRNGNVAVASSSSILKSMREHEHIDFFIPQEGSVLTIENFALPISSKNDDAAYAFMNFMMRKENLAHSYEHIGLFPPRLDVLEDLQLNETERSLLMMQKKEFEKLHLVRYDRLLGILTAQEIQDLWIKVKA